MSAGNATSETRQTVREAITRAAQQLSTIEDLRPNAARDASLLLRNLLKLSHAQVLAAPERIVTTEEQGAYTSMLQRRLAHEPVQYITGEQEFYGLALHVTPAVLIPRPETELLVEAVLDQVSAAQSLAPIELLDVGTGSGAIAIAIAKHLPHARITAVDISTAALSVARDNAARHGVAGQIRFLHSDLLAAIPPEQPPFDIIVSNPPYVPESDRSALHPQVRDYEPAQALFATESGLAIYRRLIPAASHALRPSGLLAMEFGYGQREALAAILRRWDDLRFLSDLQGILRLVLARKPL